MAEGGKFNWVFGKEDHLSLPEIKSKLEALCRVRATNKRKITIYLNKLQDLEQSGILTFSIYKKQVKEIDAEISKVNEVNGLINEIMDKNNHRLRNNLSGLDEDIYNAELDNQAEHATQVGINLG